MGGTMAAGGTHDPLETRYKRSQIVASWAQVGGTFAALAAAIAAILVAWQGQATIDHNNRITQQQSEDSQLSTAITALGVSDMAERVAGLVLLARNTSARLELSSKTGETRANLFNDYRTALQILSGYLSSHGQAFLTSSTVRGAKFGRGYGLPPAPGLPLDLVYAANQVKALLALEGEVTALGMGRPGIDLSNDELVGQPWHHVNFQWVKAYLRGIDLRGADLIKSRWGAYSNLEYSHLQCADLRSADFRKADLTSADLSGANLQHADFRGTDLKDANLTGANVQGADFRHAKIKGATIKKLNGAATWPGWKRAFQPSPTSIWNEPACLRNPGLIGSQPAPAAQQPSSPSPSPTPRPAKPART
jgi:hypothetical protein